MGFDEKRLVDLVVGLVEERMIELLDRAGLIDAANLPPKPGCDEEQAWEEEHAEGEESPPEAAEESPQD